MADSKRLKRFRRAVSLDQAMKDIGGTGVKRRGKQFINVTGSQSSAGVSFTTGELLRAKKRSISQKTAGLKFAKKSVKAGRKAKGKNTLAFAKNVKSI